MRLFILLPIFLSLIAVLTSWITFVESEPWVDATSSEQVENADTVLDLLHALRNSLHQRYEPKQLEITHKQARSLAGFVHRAVPEMRADFHFDSEGANATLSYQLPAFLFNNYVNLKMWLVPGQGLQVERVSVGALSLSGKFALDAAEYLVNTYTNSQIATVALSQIEKVNMTSRRITVDLLPMDSFLNEAKKVEMGGDSNGVKTRNIKIAHYLRLLESMYVPPPKLHQPSTSLSYYLSGLMEEAKSQSQRVGASATLENEAAILALAAFAGHRQFANFMGDFSFSFDVIPQAPQRPSLANRKDLNLHFIFSAAIKLLSEQGISFAVGEFKELMDRRSGGSGYSFIDLAADMAGTNLAALAVDPTHAQTVQNVLSASPNERLFFPSIDDLDEGMDKQQFLQKYGEVDSEKYKAAVAEIAMRLSTLPISQ